MPRCPVPCLSTPNAIKAVAAQQGYTERSEEVSSTLFFKENKPNNRPLINVFYITGGVMTKLSHPASGDNELWRNDAHDSTKSLWMIFVNPRLRTGQGYRQAGGAEKRRVKCGAQKKKSKFSKNCGARGTATQNAPAAFNRDAVLI